ncbi:SipW-dependent-type signal peptide-containing protein [Cellulomonas rhizosphaerae]|uniref:Uncharacterized protein n=1 Tax=Cellulomonas rhizosphaerae TaxID=2293719 RepID=A0A413RI62_9CELL|nr:SipW-dependent-type signal peptide-containing protein [Cellulomonas rhizosphaerae]RHA37908.1 hypothetical protein D1825_15925 [Cellulomonas rhizosphaerae]
MDARRYTKIAAIPAGLLVAGLMIGQASHAAFTAQTSTGANSFTSGSVALTNSKVGTDVFTVTGIVPGATGTKTVDVTYTGNLAVVVKMYAKDGDTTGALAQALQITVKTDGSPIFAGTLAELSALTAWSQGVGGWAPTSTATKPYEISWSLPASAGNTVQGQTTALKFAWEAQTS